MSLGPSIVAWIVTRMVSLEGVSLNRIIAAGEPLSGRVSQVNLVGSPWIVAPVSLTYQPFLSTNPPAWVMSSVVEAPDGQRA